jgi:hypothetical protein
MRRKANRGVKRQRRKAMIGGVLNPVKKENQP